MNSFEKAPQAVKKNTLKKTGWTGPAAIRANATDSAMAELRPRRFMNRDPDPVFRSIEDLRSAMTRSNHSGAGFLDFLLQGPYRAGKGVWINQSARVRGHYENLIKANPDLACESPYGEYFNTARIRHRGENRITVKPLASAPDDHRAAIETHRRLRLAGQARPAIALSGGPAAKIAAILCALPDGSASRQADVHFILDGAEQSNESGSASYEHVNHANALNAEHDNTGAGIFMSAVSRALRGEPDPAVALQFSYKKVDLWPNAVRLRDLPIYFGNEIHGWMQAIRRVLGRMNDHDKSRLASRKSTDILSYLESALGCSFRLENQVKRAVFLYFTEEHYGHSIIDNQDLRQSVGLNPIELTGDQLTSLYGSQILKRIVAGDIFPENACIRHGFDEICRRELVKLGSAYHHRTRISEIYVEKPADGQSMVKATGIVCEDLLSGGITCLPVDYLGLSLGPTATFHYPTASSAYHKIKDRLSIGLPVPYQTIATGLSAQVLFRIVDRSKTLNLPFTGMKQTHFVEIGRTDTHVLMKLTCGGVIGLPVYSRSYGISAIASLLRVMGPGTGLEFEDVVCAWPCSRGINSPNNGQIVQLADNAVCRFGEGGTGMSKMATNAQSMLDLLRLDWKLPSYLRMDERLYEHTVVDRRWTVARRLF
jgi:hypothetical protein